MTADLCRLTIKQAGELLRRKELSPIALTEAFLARIDRLNPVLHAYVTVCRDRALADALRAEQEIAAGKYRGPLHGIPIALKDIIETEGIRTTANSRRLLNHVPTADAVVAHLLAGAGAVLLGKTNTFELAIGGPSEDLPFPLARNPWHIDAYTGGSSTGSAIAVGAGLAMAAIGTDTGGSVRNPAAHCGTVALKPSFGRVSMAGIVPLAPQLDHVGTLTWTVEDTALLLSAIIEPDGDQPALDFAAVLAGAEDLKGVRIGVPLSWCEPDAGTSRDLREAFEAAVALMENLGAVVEPVGLSSLQDYAACMLVILLSEAYALFERDLIERPQLFGQVFRDRVIMGAFLRGVDYAHALAARRRLNDEMEAAFARFDALVAPGMMKALWLADIPRHAMFKRAYPTAAWNVTGHPAINVRCGFSDDGLPFGLQIAGRRNGETDLLRIAHIYERASRWSEHRPRL